MNTIQYNCFPGVLGRLSLKRGFGGCGHRFDGCYGLGGLGGFSRFGGLDGLGRFCGFDGKPRLSLKCFAVSFTLHSWKNFLSDQARCFLVLKMF